MTRTESHRSRRASFFESGESLSACVLAAALLVMAPALLMAPAPLRAEDLGPAPAPEVQFTSFKDTDFIEARRSGSPLVLYFEADWCAPCKEMHEQTFRAPAVLEAAAGYRFFRVDMTTSDGHVELLKKSFRVAGAPTVILFGPNGQERARQFGFIPPEDFARMLGEARKPPRSA